MARRGHPRSDARPRATDLECNVVESSCVPVSPRSARERFFVVRPPVVVPRVVPHPPLPGKAACALCRRRAGGPARPHCEPDNSRNQEHRCQREHDPQQVVRVCPLHVRRDGWGKRLRSATHPCVRRVARRHVCVRVSAVRPTLGAGHHIPHAANGIIYSIVPALGCASLADRYV